jgi:hypothetical protein
MTDTATTTGAREHARAQAAARAPFGPTIPVRQSETLPPDVTPSTALWQETVAPGGYAGRVLPRGATLRLVDVDGDACANLLAYSASRPIERLNVADTMKVQWQAYLGRGSLLLSDMGRVLLSIVEDTSAGHDAFCGASNAAFNERRYGTGAAEGSTPNARDRFAVALAKFGLARRDIVPNVNLFKHVRVGNDGELRFEGASAMPGARVELRAELPVLVVVANTAHVLDPRPRWTVTPLELTAWAGDPTTPGDPLWSATPEGERAFLNTEDAVAEQGWPDG